MLPIGRLLKCGGFGGERDSKLTKSEKEVMLTLWAIMRSPLMIGGHLPESKEEDLSFFKQREIIDINQNGTETTLIEYSNNYSVWGIKVNAREYRAYFNTSNNKIPKRVVVRSEKSGKLTDVWKEKEIKGRKGKVVFYLKNMSVKLIRMEK